MTITDWTDGYVADIGYTHGYYDALNPLRLRLAFLNHSLAFSEPTTACELGFGQGISVNMHSAASNIEWWGTDFNPAQAGFAQEMTTASGANNHLFDQSFAEFCQRDDLPDFDFIGMHGIWTWISAENRALVVDFVRRKLKVGGVFYISYNTQPGWAATVPLRHLLFEHSQVMGATGDGTVARIDAAIDFTERLFATNPAYLRANPSIAERFKGMKEHSRHYLAHEYFNRDWQPMLISEMAKYLTTAKLDYACSAHYLDQIDSFNLTSEQQQFLQDIADPIFKETTRDYISNQQFRRDYWVKGRRKLSALEQAELLRKQRVVLIVPRAEVSLKIKSTLGDINLNPEIYGAVLDIVGDYQPKTLAEIEAKLMTKKINFAQILQAIVVLTGNGILSPAQGDEQISQAKLHTDKLNLSILHKSRGSAEFNYLASPVTGGGVSVARFHQLFLLAISQGKKQPEEWASFVWQILLIQGQKIVKAGQTLNTAEENLTELLEKANLFATQQLPVLKGLAIANLNID